MKKILNISLIATAFLGIFKIFSILPFNKLAADDFSYAVVAKNLGFWQAQIFWYTTWTGRFTSTLLQILFVNISGTSGKIYLYSIFTFVLLLSGLIIFFQSFLKSGYKNLEIYILASVSFVALFFLTPNKTESWYWLSGSVTYLWPIIFFIFASSFIFKLRYTVYDYLIADLLIFVSVGGNETFGFLATIVLLVLAIRKFNRFNLSLFIFSAASFLVVFLSPGNQIRAGGGEGIPMNIIGSVLYSIQEGPPHFVHLILGNLYYLIPIAILFAYIFSKYVSKDSTDKNLIRIFGLFLAPIVLSIFFMLPAFKSFGRIPPDRNDITLAFISLASIIGISYFFGQIINSEKLERFLSFKVFILLTAIVMFILSFSFVKTLASDFYIAKNYSQAYDAMIAEFKLRASAGNKKEITVSLPDAGLIAVTLDPPGHVWYKNQALSDFYGIGRIITK